jgi:hypothetical protein
MSITRYTPEELKREPWAVKELRPTYGLPRPRTGESINRNYGWDEKDERVLREKVANRTKFNFNPELATERSAKMWLLDKRKDPNAYSFTLEDLDKEPETPDDLTIRRLKDNRLLSVGGYQIHPYTDNDTRKEKIRYSYLTQEPQRKERKTSFSKYYKSLSGIEDSNPSLRVYHEINTVFKNITNIKVNYYINRKLLKAPEYFKLLQAFHRTFKNCIALPYVIGSLSNKDNIYGITPNAEAVDKLGNYFHIPPVSPDFFTQPISPTNASSFVSLYQAFKNHDRYTVWSGLLKSLNDDLNRFYITLFLKPNTLISNFVSLFYDFIVNDWATGDMRVKPTITKELEDEKEKDEVDKVVEIFSSSPNLPSDIFIPVKRNRQSSTTQILVSPVDYYKTIRDYPTGLTTRRNDLLTQWRLDNEAYALHPPPPKIKQSSFIPLTKAPGNFESITIKDIRAILGNHNIVPPSTMTKKLDLYNLLIKNKLIKNTDTADKAKLIPKFKPREFEGEGGEGGYEQVD